MISESILKLEHPRTFIKDLRKNKVWTVQKFCKSDIALSVLTSNESFISGIDNYFKATGGEYLHVIDYEKINLNLLDHCSDYQDHGLIPIGLHLELFKTIMLIKGQLYFGQINWTSDDGSIVYYGLWTTKKSLLLLEEFFQKLRTDIKQKLKKPQKQTTRKPLPRGIRFEVFKRDNHHCTLCGRGLIDGITLHVDHVIPVSKGGSDELSNLRTLCDECNLNKSDLLQGYS